MWNIPPEMGIRPAEPFQVVLTRETDKELFHEVMTLKRFSVLLILFAVMLLAGTARGDSFSSLNKKGNKAYKQGKGFLEKGEKDRAAEAFEEALKSYKDAEIEKPETPQLSYNLGNVMYQQEKYQDALERFYRGSGSDELEHQAWSYYNLGNTFYRSGKYPEAIQAYKRCLELTPDDEDAKYNLEFVRKKMKEMLDNEAKRQQNQQQQQQDQQDEQQQQQQQQQQGQDQQEQQEKQQQDQRQAQQPEGEQKQQEQKQEQFQPKEGMTKEDAERILNALKEDEKNVLKQQKRAPQGRGRRGGKDW
jgi:Ca-activated chloride channel family protein